MSDVVIKAEGLGKKYTIGHQSESGRYVSLRDVLMRNARDFWNKTKDLFQGKPIIQGDQQEEIWALKDVSFGIKQGEAIGIIGRNGAGKSTLLKILSRITEPTAGRVAIKGRVASLMEVGTGFHPELTGRENIFLNGAILGMSRQEIRGKFDEIVAFAEIEKLLDTPVKRYSSGMYVRLAFAVAAHLEPEILLVDEVLAVGDTEFQKKCLGKMGDAAKGGRTVLFVSHNMAAINRLCQRGIWLQGGKVQRIGAAAEIVGYYLGADSAAQVFFERRANSVAQYRSVYVTDRKGNICQNILDDQGLVIVMEIDVNQAASGVYFGMILQNSEGVNVLFSDSRDLEGSFSGNLSPGRYRMALSLPSIFAPGRYFITLGINTSCPVVQLDNIEGAYSFEIVKNTNMQRLAPRPGVVNLKLPWNLETQNK